MRPLCPLLLCAFLGTMISAAMHGDPALVSSLPDFHGEGFRPDSVHSGYFEVNKTHGRNLFYVFVKSKRTDANIPTLLWSNGGPGCSSVGEGLWMENGPFQVSNSHAGIEMNPFGWDRLAHVLYVEHPVGVGFSYSETKEDYARLTDEIAAHDLYAALLAFSARYPQFAPTPSGGLLLSGESYAGEYIPHLAHLILTGGRSEVLRRSLRGFAVGNPLFNCKADTNGASRTLQYQMYFMHGLMSHAQYQKYFDAGCDAPSSLPFEAASRCDDIVAAAEAAVGTVNQQLNRRRRWLGSRADSGSDSAGHRRLGVFGRDSSDGDRDREGEGDREALVEANFDPDHKYQSFCLGNSTLAFASQPNADTEGSACHPLGDPGRMSVYLNRPDVQKALHIDASKMINPVWADCSSDIHYEQSYANILTNYYEPIFNLTDPARFKVLVYSGDEDIATVPAPLTQQCLSELGGAVHRTGAWRPWFHNGITAGYVETFDRYTFATVKGAGHTVPQYQPQLAFELVASWIRNATTGMPPLQEI